jgi:arsenate reductase (glutaredoxin)
MSDIERDGTTVVYGLRNCTTVRKALGWLDAHGVAYRFHDFKRDGLPEDTLAAWLADIGWEALINRRGTTWRNLPPERRDSLDGDTAPELIRENLSIIRRPVIEYSGGRLVGFDEERFAESFNQG